MGLIRRSRHEDSADGTDTLTVRPAETDRVHRAAVQAGVPGRCPECDGFGYIDHIDMVNRIQTQHCRDCSHKWEFRFDEAGDVIDLTDSALARSDEESASR